MNQIRPVPTQPERKPAVEPPAERSRWRAAVEDAADEIDLLELISALWRGKWWIALFTALALLAGGFYVFRVAVPTYVSEAVVALQNREAKVVDLESVVSGLAGDQATINTELEVLKSRNLATRLVKALALTEDPEFNPYLREKPRFSLGAAIGAAKELVLGPAEELPPPTEQRVLDVTVDNLQRALDISSTRQSYVFKIKATTTDPEKSARIANKLAELYILDQLEVKFEATERATKWLSERVAELKTQLEAAENKVKEFEQSTDLVGPEALAALNRQLKDMRERLDAARRAAAAARERLARLQAARKSGDAQLMAQASDDRTLARLAASDAAASEAGRQAFMARFDQLILRARTDAERAEAQADSLARSIKELEARIERQSSDLVQLEQLKREAQAARAIYEYFLGRLKETSAQKGIQQPDARIISEAVVPARPASPKVTLIMALSGLLGMMAGSGLVLAREMMHNAFRTAEELEAATGRVVLGQIPKIPARKRLGVIDYIVDKPTSAAAEAFRNLRTSVLHSNVDRPPKVILFSSSIPGEGKTTDAVSLAHNLSGLGKRVLLLEGDVRRRTLGNYFKAEGRPGLVSVVAGDASLDEAILHSDRLGIDVLLGEKASVNAADLFSSDRFRELMAQLRERYDYIVIDTPPVLVVPDARVIGQHADAILYTVKWDDTPKGNVLQGLHMFDMVNLTVTGLVLSQIDPRGASRYGYGGKYGSYYGYYSAKGYYDN